MGKKLIAVGEYHAPARGLHYAAGQIFEADDALYLFLMADAPRNFLPMDHMPEAEPGKAVDAPPADKMLRKPKASK